MAPPSPDSKTRFSDRVDDYVKYRPHYPPTVTEWLSKHIGLASDWVVADIGSGTGISSELFLDNGNEVFAVEPNPEMRGAAESLLSANPRFHSVDASAEQTSLRQHSCDMVVAGSAFHWFDAAPTRAEWTRILKPGGWAVVMWNQRRSEGSSLVQAHDELLMTYGIDYAKMRDQVYEKRDFAGFFGNSDFQQAKFDNTQKLDYEALRGGLLSASCTPKTGQPGHDEMLEQLHKIFEAEQKDGFVTIPYDTEVYVGKLPCTSI